MTDNLWVKAAGAAFALLTGIASWGLLRTVDVKDQVVTVSGRVDVLDATGLSCVPSGDHLECR